MRMLRILFILIFLVTLKGTVRAQQVCESLFSQEITSPFDDARFLRAKNQNETANKVLDETYDSLKKEEVINFEPLGGGKNQSYKITLANGLQAVYKPQNPERPNLIIREKAAYKLSRLLQLDIVPPTAIRKLKGPGVPQEFLNIKGSVQLFIFSATPLKKGKIEKEKVIYRGEELFLVDNFVSGVRLRLFDWLINNHDRGTNAGNYLVSNIDSYIIGIDNSVAFVGHDKTARADKVPYYKEEYLDDIEFFSRLSSVTEQQLIEALDGLRAERITEFLERYQKLMTAYQNRRHRR